MNVGLEERESQAGANNLEFLTSVFACVLSNFSRAQLFATLWTVSHQVPLSMGFFRQEYWSRLPFPLPEDLPEPGFRGRDRTCISCVYCIAGI